MFCLIHLLFTSPVRLRQTLHRLYAHSYYWRLLWCRYVYNVPNILCCGLLSQEVVDMVLSSCYVSPRGERVSGRPAVEPRSLAWALAGPVSRQVPQATPRTVCLILALCSLCCLTTYAPCFEFLVLFCYVTSYVWSSFMLIIHINYKIPLSLHATLWILFL